MPDYKAMYFQLAANVADAIDLLIAAQQKGENAYVESENESKFENMGCGDPAAQLPVGD